MSARLVWFSSDGKPGTQRHTAYRPRVFLLDVMHPPGKWVKDKSRYIELPRANERRALK